MYVCCECNVCGVTQVSRLDQVLLPAKERLVPLIQKIKTSDAAKTYVPPAALEVFNVLCALFVFLFSLIFLEFFSCIFLFWSYWMHQVVEMSVSSMCTVTAGRRSLGCDQAGCHVQRNRNRHRLRLQQVLLSLSLSFVFYLTLSFFLCLSLSRWVQMLKMLVCRRYM